MKKPVYFVLGVLFIAAGIAVWIGALVPNFPEAGYLRFMTGLVLILLGVYRCLLAFFPGTSSSSDRENTRSPRRRLF
jgi:putative Ca2+/H+ antiporter (TMEM165/GDT1 family)